MKRIIFLASMIFIFIFIFILLYDKYSVKKEIKMTCGEYGGQLVKDAPMGKDFYDIVKILKSRGILYSAWKDEVKVDVGLEWVGDFPIQIVIEAGRTRGIVVGSKDVVVINFSSSGKVIDSACRVFLIGP